MKNLNVASHFMIQRIQQRIGVAATGVHELLALRMALHRTIDTLGICVQFAPDSDPDLVDFLGVGTVAALSTGLGGAALGVAIGACWDEPFFGLLVGGLVGVLIGARSGVGAVGRGWRLRVRWLPTGVPSALMEPMG